MNAEYAKKMLPIITALAEGKKIEEDSLMDDNWKEVTDIDCETNSVFFRIKKEPRRFWIIENEIGFAPCTVMGHCPQVPSIEVIEVLK